MAHQPAISFPIQFIFFSIAPVGAHQTFDKNIMRYLLAILVATASLIMPDVAHAHQQVDVIHVGGNVKSPGPYARIENESLAALINRIGGVPATRAELERYQRGEPVSRFRINLFRDGKKREFKIHPKSNELWELLIMKNDVIEVAGARSIEAEVYPSMIILKKEVESGPRD